MIAVFGAGSIGCWIGGKLAASGQEVTLIGRARLRDELAAGLAISDLEGGVMRCRPRVATEPRGAASAAIVLVTVKSAQTAEAGAALAEVLAPGAVVVSLQNGIGNAVALRAALPNHRVLAAMVPFNVTRTPLPSGELAYHRASGGILRVEASPSNTELLAACARAQLPIEPRPDMPAVLWAKLLLNLNNAINALSGLPLKAELEDAGYRRCLAAAQREALAVLAAAGQPLARLTPLPPRWIPAVLGLPDWLFARVAKRLVAIDPHARSSMYDDLAAGRPTEIAYLQGEIVALAERVGLRAPINAALVTLIRAAEAGGKRDFTAAELGRALGC